MLVTMKMAAMIPGTTARTPETLFCPGASGYGGRKKSITGGLPYFVSASADAGSFFLSSTGQDGFIQVEIPILGSSHP